MLKSDSGLAQTTIKTYNNILKKLDVIDIRSVMDVASLSEKVYKHYANKATSRKTAFGAILKYIELNHELSKVKKELLTKMYEDLRDGEQVQIDDLYGLNIDMTELSYDQMMDMYKLYDRDTMEGLVKSMILYMNTHYTLRLDYFNVRMYYENRIDDKENYMVYVDGILTFYLNQYKTLNTYGPKIIRYDDDYIRYYIGRVTEHLGHLPKFFLYRYHKGDVLKSFADKNSYGQYIRNMIKELTGIDNITINTIRKKVESHLMQSDEYRNMTNREQNEFHNRLLHSSEAARKYYNVLDIKKS